MDVLCIGHAAWDRIITVAEMPAEDAKTEAIDLSESGGGPAANAAYLLAKWGSRTSFAGVVGADEAGRKIEADFRSVGADTRLLEVRQGHATPTSFIIVSQRYGTRTIITRKVPTEPLRLAQPLAEPPKVLLFDGHEPDASVAALEQYPSAVSILDAGSLREGTRNLAERVHFLVASERFAAQVMGWPSLRTREDYEDAVKELYRLNRHNVIITLGIRGLVHGTDQNCTHLPAFSAITVDTTAAGDIFHGAFAFGVLKQMALTGTLELASMAAALSVERRGGRASIPALEEVQEALAHAG
jgi:sugar/nucleoside kinase (ribokinase family)